MKTVSSREKSSRESWRTRKSDIRQSKFKMKDERFKMKDDRFKMKDDLISNGKGFEYEYIHLDYPTDVEKTKEAEDGYEYGKIEIDEGYVYDEDA